MVFYITLLRWMSNLSLKGGSLRVTHTKKQKVEKKIKTGGNAQQWIQGYIVQPKMQKEKKAWLERITRGRQCLIIPVLVLVVLVMVPWRDYTQWPSHLLAQWHWEAFSCTTITQSATNKFLNMHILTETGTIWQKYPEAQMTGHV